MTTGRSSALLDLASTRWSELAQAYGAAHDIPRLIDALAAAEGERERAELWFGVRATLCPDGRAYTAAYAAVPHLLAISRERGFVERVAAIHVAAEVETSRHAPGAPSIPEDLVRSYAAAIESLPGQVAELVATPWDADTARALAGALLAGKHHPDLARAALAPHERHG